MRIADNGRTASEHTVDVARADVQRLAAHSSVEDLVTRSFEFLLEREPPASILRTFALLDIQRYFPEYLRVISS